MRLHARARSNPDRLARHREAGGRLDGALAAVRARAAGPVERPSRRRRALSLAASGLLLAALAGCGTDGEEAASEPSLEPMYAVSQEAISHDTTQQILVFSPEGDGSWPVVHLFTAPGWSPIGLAQLARALAAQGVVVFAPDYRATVMSGPGRDAQADLVCSWRYGNSVAAQYGGDVDRPVTLVGVHRGGDQALELGLRGDDTSTESCFRPAPDPAAVVAIAPCMNRLTGFDTSGWSNKYAHVVLIAGSRTTSCPQAGVEYGHDQLQAAGFDTTLTTVDGDVYNMILHESQPVLIGAGRRDDTFLTAYDPDNPVGNRVAQIVLGATEEGR